MDTDPTTDAQLHRSPSRLLILSAVALFAELALIRWLATEVRIFAYFKNLILIASFVGFGLGMFRARRDARLVLSLGALLAIVGCVAISSRLGWEHGPHATARGLSGFADTYVWGDWIGKGVDVVSLLVSLGWVAALFVGVLVVLFGFAQRIGADIEDFGQAQRLTAYTINIVGSIVGVVGFWLAAQLGLPPAVWFSLAFLGAAPYLPRRSLQACAVAAIPLIVLALPVDEHEHWSPYQKLVVNPEQGMVYVNGTGYMKLTSMESIQQRPIDRYRLPHLVRPGARSVLVIGAGGGNDVAAALRMGAQRVVAVEIDPTIYGLGKTYHPDHPYADPRVTVVIDDARHFGETTRQRFDLIVFSHLDAHGVLSSFTNVRLDNYVHTVESFRTFRRLLEPGGALYVSFFVVQPWVASRLERNLTLAFDAAPEVLLYNDPKGIILSHYVASDDPQPRQRAISVRERSPLEGALEGPPASPSTDDWPYLYVRSPSIPRAMLVLGVFLLLLTAGVVLGATRLGDVQPGWFDRHFFFLGAGFLLVEVHNVGKLARVFGTTWATNTWVIVAVLCTVLLANAIAIRRLERLRPQLLYVALLTCLVAGYLIPLEQLLRLPLAPVVVTAFYTLPLLFAGLIFAGSFARVTDPARALGANILGSVCGGFLELASFLTGLSGLLLVAVVLYAASYRRPEAPAPAASGPATGA